MDGAALERAAPRRRLAAGPCARGAQDFRERGRRVEVSGIGEHFAVVKECGRKARLAKARGVRKDALQYRLDIGRRARHDAQYFGDGRLLLERLLGLVPRPAQLELGLLAVRDVAERADHAHDASGRVAHAEAAVEDPAIAADAAADAVLALDVRGAVLEVGDERRTVNRKIVAVDALVPRGWRQPLGGNVEELLRLVGKEEGPGLQVPLVDALDGSRGGERITLLGAAFGGDIGVSGYEAAAGQGPAADPHDGAVRPGALELVRLEAPRQLHALAHLLLDVAGPVFAALRVQAEGLRHVEAARKALGREAE